MKYFDVCIIGGGHSGLVTALAFAKNNFKVLCVEKKSIHEHETSEKKLELRTTAHLMPAVTFLDNIGIWKHLKKHSCPLKTLKLINNTQTGKAPSKISENIFDSEEIGKNCFGYNVPLEKSIKVLRQNILSNENIAFYDTTSVVSSSIDNELRTVQLSNGEIIKTSLLIGADGSSSAVRNFFNISVFEKNTQQIALTFNVKHEIEHKNISFEIYRAGGPLTTVPMLDDNHGVHSSIVWMNKKEIAEDLLRLNKKEFSNVLNERSHHCLGRMETISEVIDIPVKFMVAKHIISERVALIGEAAHKLPPIGAQGFNMSVKDIEILLNLALENRSAVGSSEMLNKYQIKRYPDILSKSGSVGFLNLLAYSEQIPLQKLRAFGLQTIDNISVLKRTIMRFGIG